jgi:hypothetical protein
MGIVPFQPGRGRGWGYVRFGSKADMCNPKADMCGAVAYVCFGPKADMADKKRD